jgi:hypothetical protein
MRIQMRLNRQRRRFDRRISRKIFKSERQGAAWINPEVLACLASSAGRRDRSEQLTPFVARR